MGKETVTYPTYTAPITDAESALYKPFLKELIDAAFGVIGRYFLRDIAIVDKANGTPVTAADKGAEEKMRAMIEERFPGMDTSMLHKQPEIMELKDEIV